MFCASNTRKKVGIDKNIINTKNYLNNNIARDNNLATDQESLDVGLWNYEENTEKSFKELFANMYRNNKLVQTIIDAKVRRSKKLPQKVLK